MLLARRADPLRRHQELPAARDPPAARIARCAQLGDDRAPASTRRPSLSAAPTAPSRWRNGDTVVTEINGDWLDVLTPDGPCPSRDASARLHLPLGHQRDPPGPVSSPSTTPARARSRPSRATGSSCGATSPRGATALDHPSLALPLPNGDILANDDSNDRVIVVDPRTNRIVWQYGHTGVPAAGRAS